MSDATTTASGSRAGGWALTVLGGIAGAAAGLATLGTVVSTGLDGSGSSSPTAGFLVTLVLLVIAVGVSALGLRMLGVGSVLVRALLAALVAAGGFLALWVVAIALGRLTS